MSLVYRIKEIVSQNFWGLSFFYRFGIPSVIDIGTIVNDTGNKKRNMTAKLVFLIRDFTTVLSMTRTDKKENKIFLIYYKESKTESVAKSYITNGLIICD